jgi:ABC-type Zn uptake system ZnuABC Zn-binding protein ZnuA
VLNDPRLTPGSPIDLDLSRTVELLQTDVPRLARDSPHVHGFGNPHYWLDPENARPMTAAILDALARLAPDARPRLEANRARFLAEFDAGLSRWERAKVPCRKTRVVVAHATWPYFARHFGLAVAAVERSPGVPPSPASLAALITRMRETGVDLILAGPSSPTNLATRLAGRTGARVGTLVASVGADPEANDDITLSEVNIRRLTTVVGNRAPR